MHLLRLFVGLLPASRLKNWLLSMTPGWRVDQTCHISPVVMWNVQSAQLGPHVRIGTGNVFRELRLLRLEERAELGQFNWMSAAARYIETTTDEQLRGQVWLAPHASIASRHYIDASGGLHLDRYAIIAGVRSTVLTHSLDVRRDDLAMAPVRIGERSVVFTNCTLLPGATVGSQIAVGANSVVSGTIDQPETLFAGAPARYVSDLRGAKFFQRNSTRIVSPEREARLREQLRASEGHRRAAGPDIG